VPVLDVVVVVVLVALVDVLVVSVQMLQALSHSRLLSHHSQKIVRQKSVPMKAEQKSSPRLLYM